MSNQSPIRTFIGVGVEPNDALLSLLARLDAIGRGVRTTPVDNLHVTLRFLGDTEIDLVPALSHAVQHVADQFTQDKIELVSVDAFPGRVDPSVLWVGLSPTEQLFEAALRLAQRLKPLGIDAETRPFRPHLTVARLSQPLRELDEPARASINDLFNSTTNLGQVSVSNVRLYQSDFENPTSTNSPSYTVLHEAE